MPKRNSPPPYLLHKASGQAYATIDGNREYLGVHGSPESHARYGKLLAKWQATNNVSTPEITVRQLALMFVAHADVYYRTPDGQPTGEADNFRAALKLPCAMFPGLPVSEFGPRKLEQVRDRMIENGHVRTAINKLIARVKQVFKWGVSKELVPADVHTALDTLAALRAGRTKALEPEPVLPVPEADIEAIKPHVTAPVWAMVQLQLVTGMRPSEIRGMRCGDIDRSGAVWAYVPRSHKTQHHGRKRIIFLGPRAQLILRPFLTDDRDLYVFRPTDGRAEFVAKHFREGAKVAVRNSDGQNAAYTHDGYDIAIRRACRLAKVDQWSPGRLRHNAATTIRKEFGDTDAARVVLGHASPSMTEVYALKDFDAARAVAAKIG